MGFVKCTCGEKISDKNDRCPFCSRPLHLTSQETLDDDYFRKLYYPEEKEVDTVSEEDFTEEELINKADEDKEAEKVGKVKFFGEDGLGTKCIEKLKHMKFKNDKFHIPDFIPAKEIGGKVKEFVKEKIMLFRLLPRDYQRKVVIGSTVTAAMVCVSILSLNSSRDASSILEEAKIMAAGYDYDGAIELLETVSSSSEKKEAKDLIKEYKKTKETLVEVYPEEVAHVFYHSLLKDPVKAFSGEDGYKVWMTTVDEFVEITKEMYENDFVYVSPYDFVEEVEADDGSKHFEEKCIYLPEGKKPVILSLDDLSYYHAYDSYGIASKLVFDSEEELTCEYVEDDGSVSYGAFDCVPILNKFLEEHPDGSYHGIKGVIAMTGYNGVFGYRTDTPYVSMTDLDEDQEVWLERHPDFDYDEDCKMAKKVADKLKEDGWIFASHTWGHVDIHETSLDDLVFDTKKWKETVEPIVGETDIIIFAHGADITSDISSYNNNEKFEYLKGEGFDYYMNVDASETYSFKVFDNYIHQSRVNVDGYRLWNDVYGNECFTGDFFDAEKVLDSHREDMPEI